MIFSLALNILIACLLAGTIYFVLRLNQNLSRFRESRAEMVSLIGQLNMAVASAQQAIHDLKSTAETSGADLQKVLRSGMELSDELQLIIESGNSLAARLEQGATSGPAPKGSSPSYETFSKPSPAVPVGRDSRGENSPFSFAIRDPEFDGALESKTDFSDVEDEDSLFMSEAERELHRALRAHQKTPRQMM